MDRSKSNILILIGLSCLIGGLLIYVFGDPNSTYLNRKILIHGLSFPHLRLIDPIRGFLPEFIHPLGFSLIGIGMFARNRRERGGICTLFLLLNIFFELGQKHKAFFVALVPKWFVNIPVLENTGDYFTYGTFAFSDLIAIFLGSVIAFIISEFLSQKWGNGHVLL